MFLSRIRTSKLAAEESGSALMAAIAVVLITVLVGATVAATTFAAMGVTSSTRASVQSVAAAESGIANAVVQLSAATCPLGYNSPQGVQPKYEVQVFVTSDSNAMTNGWGTAGVCPSSTTKFVKILSTGTAASSGVGNASGDSSTVEAIYKYIPPAVVVGNGAATYSYKAGNLSSAQLLDGINTPADVQIYEGEVKCTGNTTIGGSLVVKGDSKVYLQSACKVGDDVHVGGHVDIEGSVGRDVIAVGTTQSQIYSNAKITGNLVLGGSLTTWGVSNCGSGSTSMQLACGLKTKGAIGGTYATERAGAPVPFVPPWTDFTFKRAEWEALGAKYIVWPSAVCSSVNTAEANDFLTQEIARGDDIVLDARGCSEKTISAGADLTLQLRSDVTILANAFNLERTVIKSRDGARHQIRFITPDTVVNSKPDCSAGLGNTKIDSRMEIQANIAAFVYSPCEITNSDQNWRGQFYGGSVDYDSGGAGLTADLVGLPGVDLGAGTVTPPGNAGAGKIGDRVAIRGSTYTTPPVP